MRKIDKVCDKAFAYKAWIDNLISLNQGYPEYSSSKSYCHDLRANLVILQRGVCAYTEIELDDIQQFTHDDWVDGAYLGNKQVFGQLDHFNPQLKTTEPWKWENFFLVLSDINTKCKRDNPVFDILKPDLPGYNPFELLDYDIDLHIFLPKKNITDPQIIHQINHMLAVLGINFGVIKRIRKRYLENEVFLYYHADLKELNELEVYQFFTAFEMQKLVIATNA